MQLYFFLNQAMNNMASKDFICNFTSVCVSVREKEREIAHQNINGDFYFSKCLDFL